jgi:beta-N-acetylhexosaminidase
MDEMQAVAAAAPRLAGPAERRASAALKARTTKPRDIDLADARNTFAALMAGRRPAGARMAAS